MSLISICIPTKNRDIYLTNCLEDLLKQDLVNVEVVIVDANSDDNTEEIVYNFKKLHTNTKYYKSDNISGIDVDILKLFSLASSNYCWLLSDDDQIVENGISLVKDILLTIPTTCNGLTLNYTMYEKNLKFPLITPKAITNNIYQNKNINFNNLFDIFFSTGIHLGFLSCQIINNKNLQKIINNISHEKYHNCWLLIYLIGKLNQRTPNWIFIDKKLIKCRSGNDSFLSTHGIYNRLMITYINYPKIIEAFYNKNSKEYHIIINNLIQYRLPRTIAVFKSSKTNFALQIKVFYKLFILFKKYKSFWYKCLILFFIPNFIFKLTKLIYLKIIKYF